MITEEIHENTDSKNKSSGVVANGTKGDILQKQGKQVSWCRKFFFSFPFFLFLFIYLPCQSKSFRVSCA